MTRVLVVEDEESFSDALSYMLRKEGFEVAVCTTGPDAIESFDRNGADLVLLDLMLPGLPGSEVCRTLRDRSNVPVFASAMVHRADVTASFPFFCVAVGAAAREVWPRGYRPAW